MSIKWGVYVWIEWPFLHGEWDRRDKEWKMNTVEVAYIYIVMVVMMKKNESSCGTRAQEYEYYCWRFSSVTFLIGAHPSVLPFLRCLYVYTYLYTYTYVVMYCHCCNLYFISSLGALLKILYFLHSSQDNTQVYLHLRDRCNN